MIFYFSGVGNSAWVAQVLAEQLGERLVKMADYADEQLDIQADEKVGFVFPVYSWAPPKLVMDFIGRVKMSAPNYLYFVCTCGAETGKTADIFCEAVTARGWQCHAGYSVVMPNTYVSFPGFGTDADEVAARKIAAAKERLPQIVEQLKAQQHVFDCHEGPLARFKSYVIGSSFNKCQLTAEPFFTTDACTSCGRCAQTCPVHNISLVDGRPEWSDHCTQCLACFHICPVNAIQYGKFTKGKKQYRISSYVSETPTSSLQVRGPR